jgi:hypothetical protein
MRPGAFGIGPPDDDEFLAVETLRRTPKASIARRVGRPSGGGTAGGGLGGGGQGGSGGSGGSGGGGGGGGSLNDAVANIVAMSGVRHGDGELDITLVSGAVPEPLTWAMLLLGFAGLGAPWPIAAAEAGAGQRKPRSGFARSI